MFQKNSVRLTQDGQVAIELVMVLAVLVVIAIACWYGIQPSLAANVEQASAAIDQLITSTHARNRTVAEGLTVSALTLFMQSGKCNPVYVYACPGGIWYYVCQYRRSLFAGIIVGDNGGTSEMTVISGRLMTEKRWQKLGERDNCVVTVWYLPSNMVLP